jgi:hypothetical protein
MEYQTSIEGKTTAQGIPNKHRGEDHSSGNTKQALRGRPQLREYQTGIEGKPESSGKPTSIG